MTDTTLNLSEPDKDRRKFLIASTVVVGSAGTVGLLIPFVSSMQPSAKARSSGAPIRFDIGKLSPGRQVTLVWRGKPIWVLYRTEDMLARLQEDKLVTKLTDPTSNVVSQQPNYARNSYRSIQERYFVTIALCTHLGCIPNFRPEVGPADLGVNWPGGYFCPCHGSKFDFAGRVYKGVPAPTNLVIPPYQYLSDTLIEIGTSKTA